jgi:8-oxo-dGTP pyrophosphatase MutT (NUDIX family)
MNPPTHRPCVSVIVLRPRETGGCDVLLVHKPRKRDTWQIPQGGIEQSESIEEAARRELREETDIELSSGITRCPYSYQYDYPNRFKRFHKPAFNGQKLEFVCCLVPRNTKVTVDRRELDQYRWVKPRMIWRYLKRRSYRKTVQGAVRWAQTFFLLPRN